VRSQATEGGAADALQVSEVVIVDRQAEFTDPDERAGRVRCPAALGGDLTAPSAVVLDERERRVPADMQAGVVRVDRTGDRVEERPGIHREPFDLRQRRRPPVDGVVAAAVTAGRTERCVAVRAALACRRVKGFGIGVGDVPQERPATDRLLHLRFAPAPAALAHAGVDAADERLDGDRRGLGGVVVVDVEHVAGSFEHLPAAGTRVAFLDHAGVVDVDGGLDREMVDELVLLEEPGVVQNLAVELVKARLGDVLGLLAGSCPGLGAHVADDHVQQDRHRGEQDHGDPEPGCGGSAPLVTSDESSAHQMSS
jgi:hypothetical protein